MNTISRFLHLQNTQLTDENNLILTDDVVLKDGSILQLDNKGYLHGTIECDDGQLEYWTHGRLHGNPAVVSGDLNIREHWQNGVFISCEKLK